MTLFLRVAVRPEVLLARSPLGDPPPNAFGGFLGGSGAIPERRGTLSGARQPPDKFGGGGPRRHCRERRRPARSPLRPRRRLQTPAGGTKERSCGGERPLGCSSTRRLRRPAGRRVPARNRPRTSPRRRRPEVSTARASADPRAAREDPRLLGRSGSRLGTPARVRTARRARGEGTGQWGIVEAGPLANLRAEAIGSGTISRFGRKRFPAVAPLGPGPRRMRRPLVDRSHGPIPTGSHGVRADSRSLAYGSEGTRAAVSTSSFAARVNRIAFARFPLMRNVPSRIAFTGSTSRRMRRAQFSGEPS